MHDSEQNTIPLIDEVDLQHDDQDEDGCVLLEISGLWCA